MRMTKIIRVLLLTGTLAGVLIATSFLSVMAADEDKSVSVSKPQDKLMTQDEQVTVEKSDGETYLVKIKVGKNSIAVDAANKNGEPVKVLRRVLRVPKFKDVDSSYWAKEQIEMTCVAGLFEKSKTIYFRPEETISRAKFTQMMATAAGVKPLVQKIAAAKDVPVKDTNSRYIYYVTKARKIMDLDGAGNFRPADRITRAEAIVAICKMEGLTENWDMTETPFPDLPPRDTSARWISAAKIAGLLKFAEDRGYLDADGNLTNAEYAVIITKTAEGKRAIANALNFDIGYSVEKAIKK